ncbi:Crp/Fnr family transcriptional regulator [Streptosporangium sandarakinum]|uniref:Crp/Fnr family transcriptional regulator n=1 Tax=Streptosporangium sandarakinum TaxID=1260955 RepID=UPI003D90717B
MADDRNWPIGTLLHRLPATARTELLQIGMLRTLPSGHVLIHQGDSSTSVWLLLDALVKVTARVESGTEALLAVRVSGDLVGEMAVLNGAPRSATVTTCGHGVYEHIKGPVFISFLQRYPAAALELNRITAERLRWSNQRRLDLAGYETDVCLARVLLALAARHGRREADGVGLNIGVPITQAELGGLVGAKEGTVHKALRALATQGLLKSGYRTIVITDPKGLTSFADLPPDQASVLP